MCGIGLATDCDPDRATVVVYKTGNVGEIRFGPTVSDEVLDRLFCDARVHTIFTNDDGRPNGIEDMSRTVPHRLRRFIEQRDGGCVWPGCGRTETLLHVHHIRHHSKGGPTVNWILTLLCHFHHKVVHEGGFSIGGRPGSLEFRRPDGTALHDRRVGSRGAA